MARIRVTMLGIALALAAYGAASMRHLPAGDVFYVVDAPALRIGPRVVPPGWRFVPRLLGRVSTYPSSRTTLRVDLSGPRAALSREGARVELEAELSYTIPPDRVLVLHRGFGPRYETGWLEGLVRAEAAASISSVSYELVRNRDPELIRSLRSRLEGPVAGGGVRIDALRLTQTAAPGETTGDILKVSATPTQRHLVILGVDSFDWRLIDPLMAQGRMPNMARLVARGARANLRTIRPILSPVIWTSIATGVKPSRHGIADFAVTARDTGALVPVTSAMRRVPALWSLLGRQGVDVAVVAWWATWPAETVRGSMVTDRVAFQLFEESIKDDWKSADPERKKGKTFPAELFDQVAPLIKAPAEVTDEEVGWFLPGGRFPRAPGPGQRRQLDALRTVVAAAQTYHRIALRQFASMAGGLKMVYYQGPDEASHLFMRYRPPLLAGVEPGDMDLFGGIVEKYYERQDGYIGELLEAAGPGATVMLVSDHGFKSDNNRPPYSDPRIGKGDAAGWHTPIGVLVMAGPGIRAGADLGAASVLDIAPTALALFGLPASRDMDGQPLTEAFEPGFLASHPVAWIDSYGGFRRPEASAAATAEDAGMIEKLRALGYIGDDRLTAHNNRGLMAADDGDFDAAIAEFERALETGSDVAPMIRANLAGAWLQKGDPEKARAIAGQALAQDPRNKAAEMVLAGADAKKGDYAAAERHLRRALEIDPTYVAAHSRLGDVCQKQGRIEEALAAFAKAVEIAPLSPIEYNAIGNIHRNRGDLRQAMEAYREALRADPQYIGAYNNLGLCLQESGHLAEARDLYEKALAIRPENPILRNSLGTLLALQGRREQAVAEVARAVKADPNWPVGVGNLATLYFESGRLEEAGPMFEKWAQLEPASTEARLGLALVCLMSRQNDRAIALFGEVLTIDPDNIRAHIALGETLARTGNLEKAQIHLERAARIDPGIPRVYNTLGEVYLGRGMKKEAARAFRKSLALQPDQRSVRQRLSTAGG